MPEIRPFKGIIYNKEKVDISRVVTQPYDKISPAMQDDYYKRSPYNFVRIILDRILPSDGPGNNRYTRALKAFQDWMREGVLIGEEGPAIYIYDQDYVLKDGRKKSRRGFVAVMRLEDFSKGGVYPHEKTLSKPKLDRYELLKTSNANFEHIFMMYQDEKRGVGKLLESSAAAEIFKFEDEYRVTHRLSRIADAGTINKICAAMKDKKLFIADGHHRYEVSLNYRDYLAKSGLINSEHGANFRMATFVDMGESGLTIFPTHRMVKNLEDFNLEKFIKDAGEFFDVVEFKSETCAEHCRSIRNPKHVLSIVEASEIEKVLGWLEMAGKKGRHAFGLFCGGKFYSLTLKENVRIKDILKTDKSEVVLNLDVSILHLLILERLLGIGLKNVENEDNITYIREASEGVRAVSEGAYQMTFFLNPTKIEEVRSVAQSGEKMPQKSTDFYPKLSSGLVMYKF